MTDDINNDANESGKKSERATDMFNRAASNTYEPVNELIRGGISNVSGKLSHFFNETMRKTFDAVKKTALFAEVGLMTDLAINKNTADPIIFYQNDEEKSVWKEYVDLLNTTFKKALNNDRYDNPIRKEQENFELTSVKGKIAILNQYNIDI